MSQQDEFSILLKAIIQAKDVQTQLDAMENLSVEIGKADLSKEAITQLQRQLEKNGVTIPINLDGKSVIGKEATQLGRQIASSIENGMGNTVQKKLSQIKNMSEITFTYSEKNEAAQKARKRLEDLTQSIVTVKEQMKEVDGVSELKGFVLSVKNAEGAVENLRYRLRKIYDDNGNVIGEIFKYTGGDIGSSTIIKQLEKIQDKITDTKLKLQKLNTTTGGTLSGTEKYKGVLSAITNLENGVGSIKQVDNAMAELKIHADQVQAALSAGKSLNKFENAKADILRFDDTIKTLRSDFNSLSSTPDELKQKLKELATERNTLRKLETGTVEWANSYAKVKNQIIDLKNELSKLKQSNSSATPIFKTADLDKENTAYMTKVYRTISQQQERLQQMARGKGWEIIDVKGVEKADGYIKKLTATVKTLEGEIKQIQFTRAKLQANGNPHDGLMQTGDVKIYKTAHDAQAEDLQKQAAEYARQENEYIELRDKYIQEGVLQQEKYNNAQEKSLENSDKIANKFNVGDTESKMRMAIQRTEQWTDANGNATISVEKLKVEHEKLSNAVNEYNSNRTVENANAMREAYEKFDNELKTVNNSIRSTNAQFAKSSKVDNFHQKVQEFYDKNTKAHFKYGVQLKQMLQQTSNGAEITHTQMRKLESDFYTLQNQARETGRLGNSFFQSLKNGIAKFSMWTSSTAIVMATVSKIREAATELIEIDTILTEISKTSNATAKELQKLGDTSFDTASKYGRKASDYLTSVQEMNRSGFQGKQGEAMAQLSLQAQSAGDMTEDVADAYLLASNAAYKYSGDVEKLTALLDGQNEITNHYSVNMTDMAEATSQVASVASQTGVKVNELSAIIATAVSTTKKSGSEVGTSIKSIFANLQNVSSKKIVSTFDTLGISMTKMSNGAEVLKTPIELIKELTRVYNSLPEGDAKRSMLLTNLAGKYHQNVLSAILNNQDTYDSMLQTYSEGKGSSAEESQKSANSLEGRLNSLSNSWVKLVNSLKDDGSIKGLVTTFADILSSVADIVNNVGALPALLTTIVGIMSVRNVGILKCGGLKLNCFTIPTT